MTFSILVYLALIITNTHISLRKLTTPALEEPVADLLIMFDNI